MVGLESINLKKSPKSALTVPFAGHTLSSNDAGEKTYKFFLPKLSYDNALVLLRKFRLDDNGNIDERFYGNEIAYEIPKGNPSLEISSKSLNLTPKDVLGYRFVIDNKPFNDKHRYVELNELVYNIADPISADVLQTPKSIYHLMPGIFNPKLKREKYTNALGETIINDDKTARTNHFMQFDADINSIIEKIPHIKEMGFRRILSTPLFGQDNTSLHGYWTANPFQITSRFGSMEDFKDLQVNLFKNSMGFIADGAFTDEGMSGIHLRDIMRHGSKSPFVNWFELHNFPSSPMKLGVLPDVEEAYKNFEIRVVNSPVIWQVDSTGRPIGDFGEKNKNYNPDKETYIQIYDKRLTSKEQLSSDKLFTSYDIKNTANKDDIADWMDGVLPYAFPVDTKELVKKSKMLIKDERITSKEILKSWAHFELATAKESAGATLLTGNKDIFKLRFTLPASKQEKLIRDADNLEDGQRLVESCKLSARQVQNYIANVGEFWTNKTAKILREYVASNLGNARTPAEFKKVIMAKAGKELPIAMKHITEKQIQNALENKYEATKYIPVPETIEDALKEYPLEALECGDDVTSVFAYPEFKAKADKQLYSGIYKNIAQKILENLESKKLDCGGFIDEHDLIDVNKKVFQLFADDITRFLLIKSLYPTFNTEDITSYSKESLANLKDITLAKVGVEAENPKEISAQLLAIMKENASKITMSDISKLTDELAKKIKNITPAKINVANLILDKAEAGLNWRIDAAKDIAEIETFLEDESSGEEAWGEVIDFWKRFNSGVKHYNPHSYKIGEFTDTALSYTDTSKRIKNAGDLEAKMIEQGNFTTQSNYNYMFSTLQQIFSSLPEPNAFGGAHDNAAYLIKDKFLVGWNGMPGYLYSGNKNNIIFSHVAVGNHDKQRIAHSFSMNMPLAYKDFTSWNDAEKADIKNELLYSSLEYSSFYNDINLENFDSVFSKISQQNLAKMAALTDSFKQALSEKVKDANSIATVMQVFTNALEKLASKSHPAEKTFYFKTFEDNYSEIIKNVPDKSFEKIAKALQPLVHQKLTYPAQVRNIELAKLMVALPGNPTLYAGDELLELGSEAKAKNVYLQNRNRPQWNKLSNSAYKHVQDYKNTLAKIYNLRNDDKLSALVNGDTIILKDQANVFGREVSAMYRYNADNDAIVLFHNAGFNSNRHFGPLNKIQIPKIDFSADKFSNDTLNNMVSSEAESYNKNEASLGLQEGMQLKAGAIFVDALDETQKFVVKEDGNIYAQDGGEITIDGAVKILKRLK